MARVNDYNAQVIEEYRAKGGRLGGGFEGVPMLLLHHKGAKSGVERVSPVMYRRVGDSLVVFASKGGAPSNPAWYHNLRAHPETTVEVGGDIVPVVARVAGDAERGPIWEDQKRDYPAFADYEQRTTRQIPVVILEPAA